MFAKMLTCTYDIVNMYFIHRAFDYLRYKKGDPGLLQNLEIDRFIFTDN